jgi:hypothetical protein
MAEYRIPVEETFCWQKPVKSKVLETAPAEPTKGDRYIVAGLGGGWSEASVNDIAWYDGAAWKFDTPAEGWAVHVDADDLVNIFDGSDWAPITASDPNSHVQGTDTVLDSGGANEVTAAQAKEAYDSRAQWDAELGCVVFDI